MDWHQLLHESLDYFDATIREVGSVELSGPTPCPGWSAEQVMLHVTSSNDWVSSVLEGRPPDDSESSPVDPADVRGAWRASAERLRAGFAQGLDRRVPHPLGSVPAAALVLFRCTEHVIHGWDVAFARGADPAIPATLAVALLEKVRPVGLLLPATGQYSLPVLHADADAAAELLGWFGRVG